MSESHDVITKSLEHSQRKIVRPNKEGEKSRKSVPRESSQGGKKKKVQTSKVGAGAGSAKITDEEILERLKMSREAILSGKDEHFGSQLLSKWREMTYET